MTFALSVMWLLFIFGAFARLLLKESSVAFWQGVGWFLFAIAVLTATAMSTWVVLDRISS